MLTSITVSISKRATRFVISHAAPAPSPASDHCALKNSANFFYFFFTERAPFKKRKASFNERYFRRVYRSPGRSITRLAIHVDGRVPRATRKLRPPDERHLVFAPWPQEAKTSQRSQSSLAVRDRLARPSIIIGAALFSLSSARLCEEKIQEKKKRNV